MLLAIMIFYTLYILMKIYISVMEIDFIKKSSLKPAVILSKENYQQAAKYSIANGRFSILHDFFDYCLFILWLGFGFSFLEQNIINDKNSLFQALIFIDVFFAVNYVLGLPFDVYSTFVKDKKFGFSKIDVKTYITDQIKSVLLFLIFGNLFFYVLMWIVSSVELWWIWGFVLSFSIILFINMLYPTLIAPIFNKFTPLENVDLKESIEALLKKAGLNSSGVFVVDAGKRDTRLNAYFGGLGKSKRVVLFDTLVEKLSKNELLAVLGHELGHFKHKDILKNISFMAVMFFLVFFIAGNLPTELFEAFGLDKTPYSLLVLLFLLMPAFFFWAMPIFGIMSRHAEYGADAYGVECQSKEDLSSALIKLADENKKFPYSHKLNIAFYHTHPPLIERLKNLGVDL